ncbi:MAG: shikimate dehydrogenase [Chloroflexi bacterium]|nr:shikimate dehydrogenase [Chloroflexota bacterium]
MTQVVGIIGYPLGHSISPAFQQAAFDHLELDCRYERWSTVPGELRVRFDRLREPDALGANITVPYKQDALELVDEIDPIAGRIGAVNTVVRLADGRLRGYNTDGVGFLRSLREQGGFSVSGKRAAIVGAGGAARAVVYALADDGATEIVIFNRTLDRADALAQAVRASSSVACSGVSLDDPNQPDGEFDLLVQCTTIGMKGGPGEGSVPPAVRLISPNTLVCDLVYNPLITPFLRIAQGRGVRVMNGMGMLIYQGAAAFELWTGREAPFAQMYHAAVRALEE